MGFYVTTPIYYVNDVPHIGHAYTTVAADALARHHRLRGEEAFLLTGTDEHGQKVQQAAEQRGVLPQQHCDELVVRFQGLWRRLNIVHDDFIRTTETRHVRVVQSVLQRLHDEKQIYLNTYEGWYCLPCERFWTEKELVPIPQSAIRNPHLGCPECRRTVERIAEANYFFKMGQHQDWLRDYIREHPEFIQPEARRNEVLGFLERPLGDLCISRPKSRLAWGIPLPFDLEYVTYVWFDALINYISAPGYTVDENRFRQWWPASVHLIGKDILTTHSVYWSTMLRAMDLPLPRTIFAHGWWTVEGEKMSKSRGNVVDPYREVDAFGVDAFRYFLLREVPFGLDGNYSREAFLRRYNGDLANDLGNGLSRTLGMLDKYFQGTVPSPDHPSYDGEAETRIRTAAEGLREAVPQALDRLAFHQALTAIWNVVGEVNRYIDASAPWTLAKDPAQRDRLATVLYTALESLRLVMVHLSPFMPEAVVRMAEQLGLEVPQGGWRLDRDALWGGLRSGIQTRKGEPLFPRLT